MKYWYLLFFLLPLFAQAQKLPTIEEKTKDLKKHDGFLNFYWDENNGKLWLEIDKLDSELLYVTSLPAGLGSNDVGLDRGLLGEERVVKFTKVGRKVLMVQPNYKYRALSADGAERQAVEQSFAQSVIWGFAVEGESNNKVLVDATDFVLRDALKAAQRIKAAGQGTFTFDKMRSALYLPNTKNFPFNTEMEATITLINSDGVVGPFVQSVTPSADAVTLRMHHSFIQLPDAGYTPRRFDARAGYFPASYFDYSTPVTEPVEKYFITRHRLQKKDPSAAISEAVKPIVYYLDNGTPEPIRSALLEGARWWNTAFEAAGFKSAFIVNILPPDADPMDVRYNMINWVHRSTRGWSYGASITDPRTGEIIKGNVTLGSLRVRQDYLIAQGLLAPFKTGVPADDKMLRMALERMKQLAAHEVGHTLGLAHNYLASSQRLASVMDYPHPVVTLDKQGNIDLSAAYEPGIGTWDKVAIKYGYAVFAPGTDEAKALDTLLRSAAAKGLQFIADADARAPGGLHPRAHLWDNGKDAVTELKNVMKVRAKALAQFGENNIKQGMPMALLEDVLVPVYFFHRYQLEAVTKMVGGMDYQYALRGDGQMVTAPLSKGAQQQALNAALDCIEPKFLALPSSIVNMIPPRPAGYAYTRELFKKRTGLSFDALAPAETGADFLFSFLFHPQRLSRLAQNGPLHNGLSINDMMQSVMSRTWKAARKTGMEGAIQLQTEQVLLTYLLSLSIDENAAYGARAAAQKAVHDLKTFITAKEKVTTDAAYKAHLLLALKRIKKPKDAKPTVHKEIPPGAPIGCDADETF